MQFPPGGGTDWPPRLTHSRGGEGEVKDTAGRGSGRNVGEPSPPAEGDAGHETGRGGGERGGGRGGREGQGAEALQVGGRSGMSMVVRVEREEQPEEGGLTTRGHRPFHRPSAGGEGRGGCTPIKETSHAPPPRPCAATSHSQPGCSSVLLPPPHPLVPPSPMGYVLSPTRHLGHGRWAGRVASGGAGDGSGGAADGGQPGARRCRGGAPSAGPRGVTMGVGNAKTRRGAGKL